ncbi:MAG: hypothetical protein HYY59_08730 [Candidatus Omnitrophica bacterium]|nr:hypothetical protein [Candidatus Omnitrophota bacterium]
MPESLPVTMLLGIITCSLVTLVITALLIAREFRETLRRVNALLPRAGRTLDEAHRSFQQARHLLTKANRITQEMETVIHETCDAVAETLGRFKSWRERAQSFLKEHVGNGAGVDPRRHHGRRVINRGRELE